MRRIEDWMVAVAISLITAAGVWGAMKSTVGNHETRISNLETWRDNAIEQLSSMNAKLDLLLEANGVHLNNTQKTK